MKWNGFQQLLHNVDIWQTQNIISIILELLSCLCIFFLSDLFYDKQTCYKASVSPPLSQCVERMASYVEIRACSICCSEQFLAIAAMQVRNFPSKNMLPYGAFCNVLIVGFSDCLFHSH